MFFKRKNINVEFQDQDVKETLVSLDDSSERKENELVDVDNEALLERKLREAENKNRVIDDARKQLEQELAVKHYFHQRLLETLDLTLLSSLEKERAKKD
ncbi:pilus assembly protein CpaF, partial [Vibrio xuii]